MALRRMPFRARYRPVVAAVERIAAARALPGEFMLMARSEILIRGRIVWSPKEAPFRPFRASQRT